MKKKYVVYCYEIIKTGSEEYEDYECALIRAYELSSLGYNVKIEEE